MVPSNAIRQHRVLEVKMAEAKTLVNHSRFNLIEDNSSEIGIIGSGVGYYYARSVLGHEKVFVAKVRFCLSFSYELVRRFALKVKKMIVIEELRPYLEENIQRLGLQVLGKNQLAWKKLASLPRLCSPSPCEFTVNV